MRTQQSWSFGYTGLSAGLGVAAAVILSACNPKSDVIDSNRPATEAGAPSTSVAMPDETASALPDDTGPLFGTAPPVVSVAASTGPDLSNALLITCAPALATGDAPMIDDMEDGDSLALPNESRNGGWYTYEENVGDHNFKIAPVVPPRLGSTQAIHTMGTDHGAWAGVGVGLGGNCVCDATFYKGVHFWLKGRGQINIALTTPGIVPVEEGGLCTGEQECWDAYRSQIVIQAEWKEYFVPFTKFEQGGYGLDAGALDIQRIRTVEFQSESGVIDFWIDDLSFYVDEVYTPYDPDVDSGVTPPVTDAGTSATAGTSVVPPTQDASLPPVVETDAGLSADASDGAAL